MKRRKLFALLMTAAMAVSSMSMAVNVFAEEDTTEEAAESEEPAEGEPTAVTTVGPDDGTKFEMWSFVDLHNEFYGKMVEKWNEENPILDPAKDQISKYLRIDIDSGKYESIGGSKRGETTILHTDMNRESLIEARQKLSIKIKKYYIQLDKCKRKEFLKEVERECEEWMYPSVVKETCTMLNGATI